MAILKATLDSKSGQEYYEFFDTEKNIVYTFSVYDTGEGADYTVYIDRCKGKGPKSIDMINGLAAKLLEYLEGL